MQSPWSAKCQAGEVAEDSGGTEEYWLTLTEEGWLSSDERCFR